MNDEKRALVPRLRFPEFREAGEWKETTLGQCLSIRPEYGINAPSVPRAENLPTYLRITDISEDGQIRQDQKVSVAKDVTDENYLEEGDIVLARTGASVGKAYKYRAKDGRLVFAGFLIRVRADEQKLNPELLFQFLFTEQYWYWVAFSSARSGQPGINGNEYASLPLQLPRLDEQQKIADCLSSIDTLIVAQADKLDALKTHKKGLMQQLFPREGETVPRLRFPEFLEAGEWNVATLNDISKIASGGTPNRSKAEYWNGDIPWVSTSLVDFNMIEQANEYITQFGLDNSSAKIFPEGTILMAMYGQGKTRGKVAVLGIDAAINQACAAISVNDGMLSEFVFQNLAGRYEEIRDLSNQGGQENLSAALIKMIPFSYPDVESGEQQKIADCLSSLDALITAQADKLDALKTHKKGLMQQLFPSPEA